MMRGTRSPKIEPLTETSSRNDTILDSLDTYETFSDDDDEKSNFSEAFDFLFAVSESPSSPRKKVENKNPDNANDSRKNKNKTSNRSSRRPSIPGGIMSHFETIVDPTKPNPAFDEDLSNKSLFQLAREGDLSSIESILSGVKEIRKTKIINELDSNKISPLHYAARYNHIAIVKFLVNNGANINIIGDDGLTPLHFCARYKISDRNSADATTNKAVMKPLEPVHQLNTYSQIGKVLNPNGKNLAEIENSVILYLASKGGRVNEKDKYGLTPLHYAAMRGNDEAAMELLQCSGIEIEAKDEQKLTPLHQACIYGQEKVARILIENFADFRTSGESGQTPLHKACSEGNYNIVQMITSAADQIYGRNFKEEIKQMLSGEDQDQNTPLLLAVESGSEDITKHLLELKANVNHFNKMRIFPLHIACTIGSLDIVKILLNNSALINCMNNKYQTPLMVASAYSHVKIIEYLLKKGAKIEKKDKDNFTPLLLAASEGNSDSVEVLLQNGANINVVDREDKSILYWAAAQNHEETVKILLKDPRIPLLLLNAGDRYDNTALHVASENGYLPIVIALLEAGADVDNKNEDEQTPLHLAAKEGRTRICKEILKYDKFSVNDEDSDSNTALHLACIHGHSRVVATLISAGADIEARNYYLWTPLDCAAAFGQPKCAKLLIQANSPIDPMDKNKTTPLHLTARYGHEKTAALLIENGASLTQTDSHGHNALTIAIIHGKKEVAEIIIESNDWLIALKSEFISPTSMVRETPLRLLMKHMPDQAKRVFDRCMITNLQSDSKSLEKGMGTNVSAEDKNFHITFNYEFLDDAYGIFNNEDDDSNTVKLSMNEEEHDPIKKSNLVPWAESDIYDDNHHLIPEARPYDESATVLKLNHPLMILVKEKRTGLLGHPVCQALVRHKWNSFGRYVYYFTLSLYFLFVIFLTDFTVNTPAPYSASQIIKYAKITDQDMDNITFNMTRFLFDNRDHGFDNCEVMRDTFGVRRRKIALVSQIVIVTLAVIHLFKELFQLTQIRQQHMTFEWARLTYFGVENLIEWTCYVTAILFVMDFTDCHQETGLRMDWQWQIGAISITATWLNLLSNVRKFPLLGIYVVMFTDVFNTFLKFSVICLLFVVAFSLGFYVLLGDQENFQHVSISLIKTTVMMIGEFEYDDLFFDNVGLADRDFLSALPYPTISFIFFVVFVIIMSIIVMNLLVGLAVDDIKLVQNNAVLSRLAMQVTLNLDVEKIIPDFLRRRFIVRQETIYPNKGYGILTRLFDQTLQRIAKAVVEHGNESEMQKIILKQDELLHKYKNIKDILKTNIQEVELIKQLLGQVARKIGIDYEEEDNEISDKAM